LRHQDAPHLGGPGEAEVADRIVGAQFLADGDAVGAVGGQHAQHAGRHAGAHGELGGGQRGERRVFGGLDDDRAAGGQRWRDLARNHCQREIPRRDRRAHADGLAQHQQAAIVVEGRQGLAVDALGLFGEPFDEAGRIGDLAAGLAKRLALLGRQQPSQVVLVRQQQVEPFAQDGAALLDRARAPGRPCRLRGGDGLARVGGVEVGYVGKFAARGRVVHGEAPARGYPAAVHQGVGTQQGRVVQQLQGRNGHIDRIRRKKPWDAPTARHGVTR